jgi:hypothetical protein
MLLTNTPLAHQGYYSDECEHLSVTEIRLCEEATQAQYWADSEAEIQAETAAQRAYENRGYWDAREQDDMEARRGVLSFEDAHAHALGYSDADARAEAEVLQAQAAFEDRAYARHREALCDR